MTLEWKGVWEGAKWVGVRVGGGGEGDGGGAGGGGGVGGNWTRREMK